MNSTQKVRTRGNGQGQAKTERISAYVAEAEKTALRRRSDTTLDWLRYQRKGNADVRARLLKKYLPLVRNVAGRMAVGFPRSVELSDLINTGVIGLVEAFRNFDPARGVKFETYAVPRIRGAILDELRALDWVPRSTRARSREIDRAQTHLENDKGRPPTDAELARELGFTVQELITAQGEVCSSNLLSLDETLYREEDNHQVPRIETVRDHSSESALKDLEKGELRAYLVTAIDRLTEQEKLVIALYILRN